MRLVMDTSSIVFAVSNHVDPFSAAEIEFPGCEIVLSRGVIRELKGLGSGKSRHAGYAKAAVGMLAAHRVTVLDDNSTVDDWIVKYATESNALVCTNDSGLKARILELGGAVIGITRSGKFR